MQILQAIVSICGTFSNKLLKIVILQVNDVLSDGLLDQFCGEVVSMQASCD